MKRFFALMLVIATIAALLCACGGNNNNKTAANSGTVQTTVSSKYDDGYAEKYATSTKTDENGNKVYEFSGSQYDSYLENHKNSLGADLQTDIAKNHKKDFGEYAYINDEKKAVIIGIHEGQYDEASAKTESADAAEYGFKYFQNLQTPVNSIKVLYVDANDQSKIYGSFDYTAE